MCLGLAQQQNIVCGEYIKHCRSIFTIFISLGTFAAELLYIHTAGEVKAMLKSPETKLNTAYKCVCRLTAAFYCAFILHSAALKVDEDERGTCERFKLKMTRENGK